MRTIKQKDSSGCGIACVAMLVRKTYPKVKKVMKSLNCFDRGHYTGYTDIRKTLRYYGKKYSKMKKIDGRKCLGLRILPRLRENSLVALKRKSEHWHWVVFDKKEGAIRDSLSEKALRTDFKRMKILSYMYVKK